MTIYFTGANGKLGLELRNYKEFKPLFFSVHSSFDAKNALSDKSIEDVLIHCAALTDVDACEGIDMRACRQVNGIGTALVREHFPGRMIYLSTDFVFDGKHGPYSETAPTCPVNNYGISKLMGEDAILNRDRKGDTIIRTTVLYGKYGRPDFVDWVWMKLRKGEPFDVYMNEYTTPTYIPHLAKAINYIAELNIRTPVPPIINVVGRDWISKYEFAIMISNVFGFNPSLIHPARSSRTEAIRPLKAGLKTSLAEKLGIPIYSVLDGLEEYKENGYN